jgi:hypothetical protein
MRTPIKDTALALVGSKAAAEALDRFDRAEPGRPSPNGSYDRARLLRRKFGLSALSMMSAGAAALLAYRLQWIVVPAVWLQCLSAFFAAWAGLARLGWLGQSNDGDTAIERADAFIFHALCWLALYLAVAGNL